ncbi:hypothetical protein RN001_014222 [Aquatica leii]|uniref:SUN domain-containing protein n=1 Tax=Aquatica leii TaxID=1421715 RepID=A0AAN7SCR9_9COLE|nr:hypothetical protein RN001_014222 [Aquatica leii]
MSRCCCTDDMSGVTFPTPVRCNNNQSVNQRCFTVILLCAAFAFVATYFYYGFTEIQNEICNLKEEFYSLSYNRNMDMGQKSKYGAKRKKSICSKRGYGNDEENIKAIVNAALRQYDADKTTRADFALESSGGFDSFSRSPTLFGIPICPDSTGPRQIIQPGVLPGECWAFKGTTGNVVIRLLGPVFIDGVSLEHISKEISPTGLIDTAPKSFSIWGLATENDSGVLLGEFTYDVNGPTLQSFDIDDNLSQSFDHIEFKVHSNHGNPLFTCVYRFGSAEGRSLCASSTDLSSLTWTRPTVRVEWSSTMAGEILLWIKNGPKLLVACMALNLLALSDSGCCLL